MYIADEAAAAQELSGALERLLKEEEGQRRYDELVRRHKQDEPAERPRDGHRAPRARTGRPDARQNLASESDPSTLRGLFKPAHRITRASPKRIQRASNLSKTLAAKKEPAQIADERQSQLKLLIARGKEQGYLTYVEVNDHLPSEIVDPEQIEDIVNMINDMGITVYEKAPDAESLLLSDPAVARRRRRRRSRRRARHRRRRVRPHDRSRAHVHARDGHGRAAHARRRNSHRQAHRGRPRPSAFGAVELPLTFEFMLDSTSRSSPARAGWSTSSSASSIRTSRQIAAPSIRSSRCRRGRRAEARPRKTKRPTTNSEEEEVLDTGPDPEEAARRFLKNASCTSRRSRRCSRKASRTRRRRSAQEARRRVHGAEARAEDVRRAGRAAARQHQRGPQPEKQS